MSNVVPDIITTIDTDFTLLWNQIMKPIWLLLAGTLNTILKTMASTQPGVYFLFNPDKIPYMSVMLLANQFIDKFGNLSITTMNNYNLDASIRTQKTFIYDFCAFGFTTVYLSVVDSATSKFGQYFGFLSINAKYQQYWTALTMAQHLVVNKLNDFPSSTNFKITYAIFGFLKIAWTVANTGKFLLDLNQDTSSWPKLCQLGQYFYIAQIFLRAVKEFLIILGFISDIFKVLSQKLLEYTSYFDNVLTYLQQGIFVIQP